MIREIVFSCAGTTKKVADAIASEFGGEVESINLTSQDFAVLEISGEDNIFLFAVPVWGGRVPALAMDRLREIKGNGRNAIAVVVYGNRDYDDALLELCDTLSEQGFKVIAAAAFIAEHCIFPTVATNRPDEIDAVAISRFVQDCKNAIATGNILDLSKVKGNRPYKKTGGVPLHPQTDREKCVKCHVCVTSCPYDAIHPDSLETNNDKCSSCCHCISVCTQGARRFSGIMYKTVKFGFEKMCSRRREPEIFV